MANLGLLTVLSDAETLLLSDELNHASMVDACRLARGRVEVYPHADVDAVCGLLRKHRSVRRKLIVTDAVFSMDGDVAPLRELCGLAGYHGAEMVVDDAHGIGVLGPAGRGTLEDLGLGGAVRFESAGLGKAFGSAGGFVAGSKEVIDLLRNRARTFLYTTAPPPALCAAGVAAIDLVEKADAEREALRGNERRLGDGLRALGFDLGNAQSPILPVVLGENERVMAASAKLREEGFLVPAIRPPTVAEGRARLRLSVTAMHQPEDVDALLDAMKEL
jgi:8-amino-7-oxononanoate synthase